MKKGSFLIDAYVFLCPTWSKNLGRYPTVYSNELYESTWGLGKNKPIISCPLIFTIYKDSCFSDRNFDLNCQIISDAICFFDQNSASKKNQTEYLTLIIKIAKTWSREYIFLFSTFPVEADKNFDENSSQKKHLE